MKRMVILFAVAFLSGVGAFAESYDSGKHGNPIVVLGDQTVEIDGHGVVIDGNGKDRCATIGPNVTLKNFTFKNGKAAVGGGVYGGKIVDCTIESCVATEYGAALANCTASGTTITGCKRPNTGSSLAAVHGGIVADASLSGCIVKNCRVDLVALAPGFGALGANSSLSGCTVTGNTLNLSGDHYGTLFYASTVRNASTVKDNPGVSSLSPVAFMKSTVAADTKLDTSVDPEDPEDPDPPVPTTDLGLAVDGWSFSADNPSQTGTIRQGVYVLWSVVPADGATVKVASLPSGLKYATKATKDTKRGITVPAGTIYGAPSAAKTVTTKFTVTKSKAKQVYTLKLTVEALATDLVGSYVGGSESDPIGSATVKLAKTGKVSGKWVSEGTTWTLSSAGFDDYDAADGVYTAEVTMKSGKTTETLDMDFGVETVAAGETHAAGPVAFAECALFDTAYANWKAAPWKALATELKGETFVVASDDGVTLNGKVAASGAVTVKGTFETGAAKPYSATAKGTLVPLGEDEFELFLYYPLKKNKFDGYAARLVLKWDGESLEVLQ